MTNPLLLIARFEFFYQLRQPVFALFIGLVFGQGVWYTHQLEAQYVYTDPAITSYLVLSSLGVVLAVATVLMAGQSLVKDLDFRTTAYLYSLPITGRMHFAGRFLGTYAATLLLALAYPAGIAGYLVSTGTPVPLRALADGFGWLITQNVLIATSISFALTVWLRSLRGAYIGLFLVVLYFLLTEAGSTGPAPADLLQLLDPFGVDMARESAGNLSFADNPTGLLTLTDVFFINRLLWLGIALGLLTYAESRFSFSYFTAQLTGQLPGESTSVRRKSVPTSLPMVQPQFGMRSRLTTLFRSTLHEGRALAGQPVFGITLALLILLMVLLATTLRQNPDFPELPTTAHMTALRLPMGLFISAFLLVMTTESLFRERTTGFWTIHDAFPQPTVLLLLPNLLALAGVAAFLTMLLFLTGIGIQSAQGFLDIDGYRYADDLLTDGFFPYCQLILLGALVCALVNHRVASHLLNLLLFAGLVIARQQPTTGVNWFAYSFLPGSAIYSDLIGYGTVAALRLPVQLVWWAMATLFLGLFLVSWNRGVTTVFSERLRHWYRQATWLYGLGFTGSLALTGLLVWHVQQVRMAQPRYMPIRYAVQTAYVSSVSGRAVGLHVRYHHPYQVTHMLRAAETALREGEKLFGAYPFRALWLTETPVQQQAVRSAPGQVWLNEKQGWTADSTQPSKTDYVDYLVAREVFRQWLDYQLQSPNVAGSGFVRNSLAEYLALQQVRNVYGDARLRDRIAQRMATYSRQRRQHRAGNPAPLQSVDSDPIDEVRAPLMLTSIGQVWGDKPLSYTIGQFYRDNVARPGSATATGFARELTKNLPDSLQYLRTYLSDRFTFDVKVGRVANLVNGLRVEVLASKWRDGAGPLAKPTPVPINDYLPLIVLDAANQPIYRQLIRPNPDEQFAQFAILPVLTTGRKVIVDPLGSWPEPTKRDNAKLF